MISDAAGELPRDEETGEIEPERGLVRADADPVDEELIDEESPDDGGDTAAYLQELQRGLAGSRPVIPYDPEEEGDDPPAAASRAKPLAPRRAAAQAGGAVRKAPRGRPRWWLLSGLTSGVLAIAGLMLAGYYYYQSSATAANSRPIRRPPGEADPDNAFPGARAMRPQRPPEPIHLGVAYGTEKELWLKWAVGEFQKQPAARQIEVELIPMGSLEAAHAILKGDTRIHVWSPASSMYRGAFVNQWKIHHNEEPIVKEQMLALTPLVFVMWSKRYEAFVARFRHLTFQSIADALEMEGGWGGIADKPDWGLFKFGHTHPNQSNSGLMTLVLAAYEYHNKTQRLTPADIVSPRFQNWLGRIERGATGLSNSTGNMMKEMVLKGPSAFDVLMVYESVAIERLKNAEGRWDQLRIVYPRRNLWCDNPYYILNAPWCTPAHQQAAATLMDFLMSEPVQRQALEHGFRPGDPAVPIRFPASPFVQYEKYGLQVDLPSVCEQPSAEALDNLLQSWLRMSQLQ